MRDLLGKVAPGFVAVSAGASALSLDVRQYLPDDRTLWLLWTSALPILFLVGLAVQIASEFIGLHSASPRPRYVLFGLGNLIAHALGRDGWSLVNRDFDMRLAMLRNPPAGALSAEFYAQRERWVYLKEGSGNMATALFIAGVCLVGRTGIQFWCPIVLMTFGLSLVLYLSHWIHAHRQAIFEIRTLNRVQANGGPYLPNDDAQQMLKRIRGGDL
jgi:hypothetical protein